MKKYALFMLLLVQLTLSTKTIAQNIAINATGSLPDTSAMLDISSTNKGFLAPRMTTTQQNTIPLPANGLLIFNTTDNIFKVNTGSSVIPVWAPLSTGSSAAINSLNGLTGTTQTFATGTTGTDFGISSSGTTHTFNLPTASATNRGALSSVDWSTFNGKQGIISGTGYSKFSGTTSTFIPAIPNSDLANSAITIQGTSTSLGSTVNIINGTGFVKASGTTISYDNNTYLTAATGSATARSAVSLTTTGTSGVASYNNGTGVLNIPGYTLAGLGGIGLTSLAATAPLSYNNGTGAFTISQANTSTSGYLSSTDWNTFNNKGTGGGGSGSVTSVAALTLSSSGSDITSSVANGTTTPVITLNIPTASASNRGALSSSDWTNFNNKVSLYSFQAAWPLSYNNSTGAFTISTASGNSSGYLTASDWYTFNSKGAGSVTNVGNLILGYSGTDITSSITNTTTTPVITLNVPTASASSRGALSSYDWTNFNSKIALSSLSANWPLTYNNTSGAFNMPAANGSTTGYLSSTDWSTFNSKQAAISGTSNRITVASNTVDISSSYVGQTSLTTLGTIGTGTWNGTAVGATYGGTGQTAVSTGDILYGSASNTWSRLAAGTSGQVLTLASSGIPSWTAGTGWFLTGNAGITQPAVPSTYGSSTIGSSENYLGTKDAKDLVFATNSTEKMRLVNSSGYLGIGTAAPSKPLDLEGNLASGMMKIQNTNPSGYSSIDIWSNTAQIGNVGFSNGGSVYPNLFYFATNTTNGMVFSTNNTARMQLDGSSGNIGIGTTFSAVNPATAALQIKPGTTTAGSAPLKLTSGINLTTPEDGAVEYNGIHFYATIGASRYQLDQQSAGGTTTVANGGTGQSSSLNAGGVMYGSSATAMAATAAGISGQVLQSAGAGAPVWVNGGSMMLSGNSNNVAITTVNTSTNNYFPMAGSISTVSTTDVQGGTRTLVSRAGTIRNLYVLLDTKLLGNKNLTITVYKNGVIQTLAVSLNTPSGTSGSDTTHSFTLAAGDEVGIVISSTSTPTNSVKVSWSADFNY